MKNKTLSSSTKTLNQFKVAAEHSTPKYIDFSNRVMEQLDNDDTSQGGSVRSMSTSRYIRKPIFMIAATLIIIMLSGFGYMKFGWGLSLTDQEGNAVMNIRTGSGEVRDEENNIANKVKSTLAVNEGAMIVYGREAIDAAKSGEIPINYTSVTKGEIFTNVNKLYSQLQGVMKEVTLPMEINDAKYVESELAYSPISKINPVASLWQEVTDKESHMSYAYQSTEMTDQILTLQNRYEKGNTEYLLDISPSDQPTADFYVDKVSSSNVYRLAGVAVYRTSIDGKEMLIWNRVVDGGSLLYWLSSDSANIKKMKAFAEEVIKSYSSIK